MTRFIDINELFKQVKTKTVMSWIDKITFSYILIIWVIIIIGFGLVYHLFTGNTSSLIYNADKGIVNKISDTIYFSFVTATTTGFGDIIPKGVFKFISIFEVIFGLLLLALVTSKLVSIKQDLILNELYESSLNEKINRMRSSLLLFRQTLSRVITKIEEIGIKKREVAEMYMYISSFEDSINESITLVEKTNNHDFTSIDPINIELLLNSILSSFEKLNELITILNIHKIEWRRDITVLLINKCIAINEDLFTNINSLKNVPEKIIKELNWRKKAVIITIKNGLGGESALKPEGTEIKVDTTRGKL